MTLETLAASKLIQTMLSKNASQEELDNAKKYLLSAVGYDVALLELKAAAKETGILELSRKYAPGNADYGVKCRSGRYPWGSGIKVGDNITVELEEFGNFTATAYEVTDNDILFIFNDYIEKRPMNFNNSNDGGYENSDLKKWIDTYLYGLFPQELKTRLVELTLPTVGQVIGWENEWDRKHLEPDGDEQLPLMKNIRNRVAYFNNECEWGWLRNAMKKEYSSACFANVNYGGDANYCNASNSGGVRPAFRLKK